MRAVLVLHYYVGMSASAVAETLDIPKGTAQSRLHRALAELRAAIAADERSAGGTPDGDRMNRHEHLERELTTWFVDTAAPRVPDFTDDILRLTAGTRQRPRWSFPERWLPMSVITLGRRSLAPLPWRTIGLLAVLAVLIAASVAFYIGSQQRLPAPFGLAANGVVAYASGGDIFTVDPATGTRQLIVAGPENDQDPRFSLDGTRLVFMRGDGTSAVPVIADADGSDPSLPRPI